MSDSPPPVVRRDVSLASLTTLGLGGPARFFAHVQTVDALEASLAWAAGRHPVQLLAGGSNVVFPDAGYAGLVIHIGLAGRSVSPDGRVYAAAGESWDELVRVCAGRSLAGVECLAGIPGSVGATPIQNVGAYGQEVCEVIESVELLDRTDGSRVTMSGAECGFGYRTSGFKRDPGRWIVLGVHFRLRPGGEAKVAYGELARALEGKDRSLGTVRDTVVELRRKKSMVLDPSDVNARSAGSFFTNPILTQAHAKAVVEQALSRGIVQRREDVPTYDVVGDAAHRKLAAGWLIERAGISKGARRGGVGVSSRHALALVNHGEGTTTQLLDLAREIRSRVQEVFGVTLEAEPTLVDSTL